MVNIKSLSIATDGSYKRLAVTYDEIDDTGKIVNGNVKVNRVIVDETVLHAVASIEDFAKVELKAAKVIACEPIKKAKKLLKLTLDDGSGTPRTVASGIAPWYKPEELIGKTVVVVANLKPATLCGVESNGMILAADAGENDVKVIFLEGVPAGAKVR